MTKAASLLDNLTRFLLFTGKGGVGKTSLACAAAVILADRGKRILLVSTDPASNLDEVLETRLGSQPTPVGGVSNLAALNIDPEAGESCLISPKCGKNIPAWSLWCLGNRKSRWGRKACVI